MTRAPKRDFREGALDSVGVNLRGGTPSDADVIRASIGEASQFALVFERHYDRVRRFLVRRFGSGVGEELAAETFAQAIASRQRYDLSYPDAGPWLFGIAANLARRHAREEVQHLRLLSELQQGSVAIDPGGAIDMRMDVARALVALDPEQREALLLHVWGGFPYEDVARVTGLPIGTVRSRISRGKRRLRELLDSNGASVGRGQRGTVGESS